MGYFTSGGTWQDPNMTSWQGYPSGSMAAGALGGGAGHETGETINEADRAWYSAGDLNVLGDKGLDWVDWGSVPAGPSNALLGGQLKGIFGQTDSASMWPSAYEYVAFSPMGKQAMGQEYDPGTYDEDVYNEYAPQDYGEYTGGQAGRGKRFAKPFGDTPYPEAYAEAEANLDMYVGPTYTGGWKKDMEPFRNRKARLMDTPEWAPPAELSANPDASSMDVVQGGLGWQGAGGYRKYSTYSPQGQPDNWNQVEWPDEPTADVRGVGGTLQKKNIYGKSHSELLDLVKREFGTFDAAAIHSLKPFPETEQGREQVELQQKRDRAFGSLQNPGDMPQLSPVKRASERLSGFLDYIDPSTAEAQDIFNIQYHNVDNPLTTTDERQTIDWEKTLRGASSVGDIYGQQMDKYFGPGGEGAFADYDPSQRGDFIQHFLGGGVEGMGGDTISSIYGKEGLQGAASARRMAELDVVSKKGEIGDIERERELLGADTREGLLGETLASQAGLYESGFAGMGERPEVRSARQKLLETGEADLTDIQRRLRTGKEQLGTLEEEADWNRTTERELMQNMKTPWQMLQRQLEDMTMEYGTQWQSQYPTSWHADLWDTLETHTLDTAL